MTIQFHVEFAEGGFFYARTDIILSTSLKYLRLELDQLHNIGIGPGGLSSYCLMPVPESENLNRKTVLPLYYARPLLSGLPFVIQGGVKIRNLEYMGKSPKENNSFVTFNSFVTLNQWTGELDFENQDDELLLKLSS